MKSFRQYIKEDGPSNGTGLFTYGLGFFADVVPDDFDVEEFEGTDDIDKKKIRHKKFAWEVENALYAERRREMVVKWLKAAGANAKEAVGDQSLPQVPDWQTAKR
jgi:hypothetical protein